MQFDGPVTGISCQVLIGADALPPLFYTNPRHDYTQTLAERTLHPTPRTASSSRFTAHATRRELARSVGLGRRNSLSCSEVVEAFTDSSGPV